MKWPIHVNARKDINVLRSTWVTDLNTKSILVAVTYSKISILYPAKIYWRICSSDAFITNVHEISEFLLRVNHVELRI